MGPRPRWLSDRRHAMGNSAGAKILDAASKGDLETLEKGLAKGKDVKLEQCTDAEGNTALHLSAAQGHVGVVEFLVELSGRDLKFVNQENKKQQTAYMLASAPPLDAGKKSCASYLLNKGADARLFSAF